MWQIGSIINILLQSSVGSSFLYCCDIMLTSLRMYMYVPLKFGHVINDKKILIFNICKRRLFNIRKIHIFTLHSVTKMHLTSIHIWKRRLKDVFSTSVCLLGGFYSFVCVKKNCHRLTAPGSTSFWEHHLLLCMPRSVCLSSFPLQQLSSLPLFSHLAWNLRKWREVLRLQLYNLASPNSDSTGETQHRPPPPLYIHS